MQGCARQGGVESPWCFNLVIRTIYAERREQLEALGSATPLLRTTPMLGWADNLIFVGDTLEATQRIIDDLSEGMMAKGMRWKPSAMEYMCVGATTATTSMEPQQRRKRRRTASGDEEEDDDLDNDDDDDDNHEVQHGAARHDSTQHGAPRLCWSDYDDSRHRFTEKTSLEILGCLVTTEPLDAVYHRLSKAEMHVWTHKAFLLGTIIPWERKVREYAHRASAIALYGAVLWTWNTTTYLYIRA